VFLDFVPVPCLVVPMMRTVGATLMLQVCLVRVFSNTVHKSTPIRPLVAATWARTRDVQQSLREVLNLEFRDGHQITDAHLDELEKLLKPLFAALPKTSKGLLGHSTVRYALHRHFVHHRGMYVRGLEPAGEAWNSSSPVDIMEDKVPSYVQHLFEERLQDGFSLHELALFAATLEHFVHYEDRERLMSSYRLTKHEAGLDGSIKIEDLEKVLEAYMAMFIGGEIHHEINEAQLESIVKQTPDLFPGWEAHMKWQREIQREILQKEAGSSQVAITFPVVLRIVETLTQRYGAYQNEECRLMSKALSAKERRGTGRMRLRDFYGAGWQFTETKEYLRELGALDERFRKAEGPWVVIPNYVVSVTNCLASSGVYSVCCMDPCEEILRHLELRVGEPTANPDDLVNLVSTTSSDTIQAPRGLSLSLVNHLNEIAETHNGRVPLHGRLFAQWLHHAYPRECVYPVLSGTTQPLSAEDWMLARNGTAASISDADLRVLLAEDEAVHVKDLVDGDMEETLPWDAQEELVFHHAKPSIQHEVHVVLRGVSMIGAIYAVVVIIVQMLKAFFTEQTNGLKGKGRPVL
jgi:hypothetical protein